MPCPASPLQTLTRVPTAATAVRPSELGVKVAKTQNKGFYPPSCAHAFSSERSLVGMAREKRIPMGAARFLLQEEDRFGSPACPRLPPADTSPGRSRSAAGTAVFGRDAAETAKELFVGWAIPTRQQEEARLEVWLLLRRRGRGTGRCLELPVWSLPLYCICSQCGGQCLQGHTASSLQGLME